MLARDQKEFAEAMNQLFAIYGDEVTNRMRDAWWGVLMPYKLNAIMAAMNLHAGDVERGTYRPTPADIRRHLEVTIPGMIKDRRDQIVRDARERLSPLKAQHSLLRNDVRIGVKKVEDARGEAAAIEAQIRAILSEPDVVMAMAPQATLRDDSEIGPRDRTPDMVRRAMGWLGKQRSIR